MKCIRAVKTIVLAGAFLTLSGCSSPQDTPSTPPSAAPASVPKPTASVSKDTTFSAEPNPIQVCDGSGLGTTVLTYSAKGPSAVEIHLGTPNGPLLSHTGPVSSATTGKWVNDGMVFYLQDVSGGKPLTAENTLGILAARVTTAGCK